MEKERETSWQRVGDVVASSISGRSSGDVTGSSPSATPCLHSCAGARPAGRRLRKPTSGRLGTPRRPPPQVKIAPSLGWLTVTSSLWVLCGVGGACACGSEGRSGRWCVRRAAAGGDKPARVSSWAHRFNKSTPWNRERRRRGFRGGDNGTRDRRSRPGSAGDGRDREKMEALWVGGLVSLGDDLRFRL
jgi:hypothetical protein